jgi:hypothetical protein
MVLSMLRRLLALFFSILIIQVYFSCFSTALARSQGAETNAKADQQELAVFPSQEVPTVFKSGAKYDPTAHRWLDRYSGKPMNLGLPGVSDRYGAQNVIATNDVIAANSGPGTGSGTTGGGTFTFKHCLIFTLIGLGIATSIAVPVAVGVSRHDHYVHHQQDVWQQNNAAAYFFFHNQTIPGPKFILPPPPPFIHHGKPSGPPP